MRVLVCGGRKYRDARTLYTTLDRLRGGSVVDAVIEGNAPGADRMAGYWARKNGITNLKYDAEWTNIERHGALVRTRRDGTKYDALAGHIRNQRMIDEGKPDLVVAFPGGTGTADMVRRAREVGIEVVEIGS